ncbi:hypothetical protein [Rickettsiella endosymbiont of Rhagonycha lignosa]|uniref:hypothetical protein n=1 Tax=Rickettsiella endosymbiont of Rhagonycha lignosa TaxID=3077937 RepID=UPI00313B10D2
MFEDNVDVENPLYESFEDRNKKEFLEKIITDIDNINQSLDKIFDDLSVETQILIASINNTKSELNQLINDKEFYTPAEKEIFRELQGHLEKLPLQLMQLPYSNQQFINNLCKAINTLLEKLADFFMNGPLVSEGVYIANPSQPYHFNFFHPSRLVNTSVEDLSKGLNAFSTSP